jgi:hypothetical protein
VKANCAAAPDGWVNGATKQAVDCYWNVMVQAQKPGFVFRRNGRVHLNLRWRQFISLLAAEVCASAIVMLDKPCSEVVWRVLATHSILQFPLHFPYGASPCAITFQLDCTMDTLISNQYTTPSTHHLHDGLTLPKSLNQYSLRKDQTILTPKILIITRCNPYLCFLYNFNWN